MTSCSCSSLPPEILFREYPSTWPSSLEDLSEGRDTILRRCPSCGCLWAFDLKHTPEAAFRMASDHEVSAADLLVRREAILPRILGGEEPGTECGWRGCSRPRLRRVAY